MPHVWCGTVGAAAGRRHIRDEWVDALLALEWRDRIERDLAGILIVRVRAWTSAIWHPTLQPFSILKKKCVGV